VLAGTTLPTDTTMFFDSCDMLITMCRSTRTESRCPRGACIGRYVPSTGAEPATLTLGRGHIGPQRKTSSMQEPLFARNARSQKPIRVVTYRPVKSDKSASDHYFGH
jgi:hypothetical protein